MEWSLEGLAIIYMVQLNGSKIMNREIVYRQLNQIPPQIGELPWSYIERYLRQAEIAAAGDVLLLNEIADKRAEWWHYRERLAHETLDEIAVLLAEPAPDLFEVRARKRYAIMMAPDPIVLQARLHDIEQLQLAARQRERIRLHGERLKIRPVAERLRRRNWLDPMRLLLWLFWMPQRIWQWSEEHLHKTGAWLTSTLTWLPLIIVVIGIDLQLMEYSPSPILMYFVTALVFTGWFFTGVFGDIDGDMAHYLSFWVTVAAMILLMMIVLPLVWSEESELDLMSLLIYLLVSCVGFGVALAVADLTTNRVAQSITFGVGVVTVFWFTMGLGYLIALGVKYVVGQNLQRRRLSLAGLGIFVVWGVFYAGLTWLASP